MAVQTTYSINHAPAIAGMVADTQLLNTISKLNKGATTIPYGKGVVSDGEDGAALPGAASTAEQFNGVVMYEVNRAQADGDVAGAVSGYDFTVVSTGVVWVRAAENIVKDQPVYLRVGATNNGDFANTAGTGDTLSVAIPGAKFVSGGNAGELVKASFVIGG